MSDQTRPRQTCKIFLVCGITLGLMGCGVERYEQRLEATKQYFTYLDKLDQQLSNEWRSPPIQKLRVPKSFQEIPATLPADPANATVSDAAQRDPRQPDFLEMEITGLTGAWKGAVDTFENNQKGSAVAYLYVSTNQALFFAGDAQRISEFSKNQIQELETALRTNASTEPQLIFPKGHQFSVRQTYDQSFLRPTLAIHDMRYLVEVYAQKQGDNQAVIFFVRPESMDPQSKMTERIHLMLETMKLSADKPPAPQSGKPGRPVATPATNF